MPDYYKTLSISIAAYNVEDTIERALESILDPSIIDDIEIFVVDDGGKDRTLEIAKRYAEKYPHTVIPIHKKNGGYGSTINRSIEEAHGKYFKQLDGDDWFLKDNLKEFVLLLKHINTDCVITEVADYRVGSGKFVVNEKYSSIGEGVHAFKDTYLEAVLTMHGTAIRTQILKENNIRITEHCFYSDTELVVFPMKYMETFYLWKKPLYVYLTGSEGQSMSISGIKKHYQDHDRVFWELVHAYNEIPIDEKQKKDLVYRRIKKEAIIHYKFLMRLDVNKKHFREIKTFGNRIKRDINKLYIELKRERRSMRIMWMTNYLAYPLLSKKVKFENSQH